MATSISLLTITRISVPGASQVSANAINDRAQVVGQFSDGKGRAHGFVYQEGALCQIDYPTADVTSIDILGINNLGQFVGMVTTLTATAGFLYDRGTFSTLLQFPGTTFSVANGINNRGEIVGVFQGAGAGPGNGAFLHKAERYLRLQYPGATETSATGINESGQVVGNFVDAKGTHGFVYLENVGVYSPPLVNPPATTLFLRAVNDEGQIVGGFLDKSGNEHPFIYVGAELHPVLIPGATSASINGINNRGQIVGNLNGPAGPQSFIAALAT
jgi:probable HAF family extracellular repeat protein